MALELVIGGIAAIAKLADLAKGLKGGEVLEKHLNFLRDQILHEGKAFAKTEEKLRESEKKVAELEFQAAKDFVRFNGNLFRVLPSGKLDFAVYCERCRISAGMTVGFARCHTPECKWSSNIPSSKLGEALKIVAAEYSLEVAEPLFEQGEPRGRQVISRGFRPPNDSGGF